MMQTLHMPDETCDICGEDFRPCAFGQHWETCDGTILSRNSAAHHKKLFKFWVEVPEAFESSSRRRGRCLLCPSRDKLVCHQAFIQHVQVMIILHNYTIGLFCNQLCILAQILFSGTIFPNINAFSVETRCLAMKPSSMICSATVKVREGFKEKISG